MRRTAPRKGEVTVVVDGQTHGELTGDGRRPRVGRDRRHVFPRRQMRVSPSFTDEEQAEVVAAARRAGLTPTGFCAVAALTVARGAPLAPGGVVADASASAGYEALANLQAELFDARTEVNRVGTNLNQAVAVLNAAGTVPVWLATAVSACGRVLAKLDEVITVVHRRVP